MMTNLFSSFDPSTGTFLFNWLQSLLSLFFPINFLMYTYRNIMIFMISLKTLNNELNTLMGNKSLGSSLIFMSLFLFIF